MLFSTTWMVQSPSFQRQFISFALPQCWTWRMPRITQTDDDSWLGRKWILMTINYIVELWTTYCSLNLHIHCTITAPQMTGCIFITKQVNWAWHFIVVHWIWMFCTTTALYGVTSILFSSRCFGWYNNESNPIWSFS